MGSTDHERPTAIMELASSHEAYKATLNGLEMQVDLKHTVFV
jgi:hypothetical protein